MAREIQVRNNFNYTDFWHHLTAKSLHSIVPPEKWNSYFKFTFVRNPWDRLVSHYFYHKRRVEERDFQVHNPEVVKLFNYAKSFGDWIRSESYVMPQSDYILDENQGSMLDFIGKCENIKKDFSLVCQAIGIKANIPHANRTKHRHYREYYTNETREIVERKFERDITILDYTF